MAIIIDSVMFAVFFFITNTLMFAVQFITAYIIGGTSHYFTTLNVIISAIVAFWLIKKTEKAKGENDKVAAERIVEECAKIGRQVAERLIDGGFIEDDGSEDHVVLATAAVLAAVFDGSYQIPSGMYRDILRHGAIATNRTLDDDCGTQFLNCHDFIQHANRNSPGVEYVIGSACVWLKMELEKLKNRTTKDRVEYFLLHVFDEIVEPAIFSVKGWIKNPHK